MGDEPTGVKTPRAQAQADGARPQQRQLSTSPAEPRSRRESAATTSPHSVRTAPRGNDSHGDSWQEYVNTLLRDVEYREQLDYATWEGRYQVLLAHLAAVHERRPEEDDLTHYGAKYYKFDDVVAKLTDVLAHHERTKPSNVVNIPRCSKDACSGSCLNVSIPLPRGATETYTAREGNIYEWTPVKDELAPAGMSLA